MNKLSSERTSTLICAAAALALLILPGCELERIFRWDNLLDPSNPVRPIEHGSMSPIWATVSAVDPARGVLPNSAPPTRDDLLYVEEDYVIGPKDELLVSVMDLLGEGMEVPMSREVSHTGYISLVEIPTPVKAAGLTASELTDVIKDRYRQANILKEPIVNVMVVRTKHALFHVRGAIQRPGSYPIFRKDFRIIQALALAGDVVQSGIKHIYVIRPVAVKPKAAKKAPDRPAEQLPELPEAPDKAPPDTLPAGDLEDLRKYIPGHVHLSHAGSDDRPIYLSQVNTGSSGGAQAATSKQAKYVWTYTNGGWVRVPVKARPTPAPAVVPQREPLVAEPGPVRDEDDRFGWKKRDAANYSRVIAVDLRRLNNGDPRMNIVIHSNDTIHVPQHEAGEFYIGGQIQRPGPYSLTGRDVTAKQAVIAAGMFGPLGWPNNSILIRRIGNDQELRVPLLLDDIFAGREPDIFLKPNDQILVGSHIAAPFLAVWRNAFRMTYGFGFIYDRNYSEYEFEIPLVAPKSDLRKLGPA